MSVVALAGQHLAGQLLAGQRRHCPASRHMGHTSLSAWLLWVPLLSGWTGLEILKGNCVE